MLNEKLKNLLADLLKLKLDEAIDCSEAFSKENDHLVSKSVGILTLIPANLCALSINKDPIFLVENMAWFCSGSFPLSVSQFLNSADFQRFFSVSYTFEKSRQAFLLSGECPRLKKTMTFVFLCYSM